jgi:hypothetical protein
LRKELESKDFQTDMVVIKGIKTGSALITVKLKEAGYELVRELKMTLNSLG